MKQTVASAIPQGRLSALALAGTLLVAACAGPSVVVPADREPAPLGVTVHWGETRQTLRGFGASDAWTIQRVGLWEDRREQVARLLFSTDSDPAGNPLGIGLTIWRFNIGAGSAEQGEASGIRSEWRRAEGFLQDDGTYDWSRQAGQQWFLRAAREHGVPTVVGFANSPPVELTRNGRAWGDGGPAANIAPERYDDFAAFLTTVAGHFRDEGLPFDYVSPINEPQWDWSRGNNQEGSPYLNAEVVALTRVLDRHLAEADLATRVEIPEAARIDFLYSNETGHPDRDNQLRVLFEEAGLHELDRVAGKVAGHSYFTTWPVEAMIASRTALRDALRGSTAELEYWMSEYCVLEDNEEIEGPGRDLGMHTALYVARLIHFDLTLADAASWQWWLGVSRGDYKDGLVYVDQDTRRVHESKLLWALGNYSRFLRPGAVRLAVRRSDGLGPERQARGVMVSAYRDADGRPVVVAVNYGGIDRPLRLAVDGLPGADRLTWRPYVTSAGRDLEPTAPVEPGDTATVPARSVVTFLGDPG